MTAKSVNQREWYTVVYGSNQFTLPTRYQEVSLIAEGRNSVVVRATDTEINKYVAIKKIIHPFRILYVAKQTYRKLKLLIHLNRDDTLVVPLYNVFTPERELNDFQTLYLVFKYIDYGLDQVIRSNMVLTEDHIKHFIYLLLCILKFIHSAGIFHCRLAPRNFRVNKYAAISISDFGNASDPFDERSFVSWWRAPESLFDGNFCDDKLDVWSIGCIVAELILRKPLFRGTDIVDQVNKIFEIIGTPHSTILDHICPIYVANYIRKLPLKPRRDFNELFGYKYHSAGKISTSGISAEGIDLLDSLLTFDRRIRPTAEEALAHPYLKELHDPTDEPTSEYIIDEDQDESYTIEQWKSIVWKMVVDFVPPTSIHDVDE
ncbi:hypothetical protein I4U23_015828 [Adineta vaga]|nr:hypothetical protein I4U23_015828 [Adineta vaga]